MAPGAPQPSRPASRTGGRGTRVRWRRPAALGALTWALLSAMAALAAAAPTPGTAAAPGIPAGGAAEAAADVYDVQPLYLSRPDIADAYATFRLGSARAAAEALRAALQAEPPGADAVALSYLLAAMYARAGRTAERLQALAAALPCLPLADRAHLQLGRAAEARGQRALAIQHYRQVTPGGPEHPKARLAEAALHALDGATALAARALREVLGSGTPDERLQATFALADLSQRSGDADHARELLLGAWNGGYASGGGEQAANRLRALGVAIPFEERVVRLVREVARTNVTDVARELRRLVGRKPRRAERVAAWFGEAEVARQKKASLPEALRLYERALDAAPSAAMRGHLLHGQARAQRAAGQPDAALSGWRLLLAEQPEHPVAWQARADAGQQLLNLSRFEEAFAILQPFGDAPPTVAGRAHGLWLAAWARFRAGDAAGAEPWLDKLERQHGRERLPSAGTWGQRARYWRARVLVERGLADAAEEAFRGIVREEPLNYYATLACARLGGSAGAVRPPRPPVGDPPAPLGNLAGRQFRRHSALDTAVLLTRLGLFGEAIDDLDSRLRGGTLPPDGKVLLGILHVREGDYWRAHRVFKRYGLPRRYPEPADLPLWRLTYPFPYRELVEAQATEFQISPAFVVAVMRHESGFRADVRSYAGAVGLLQLMPASAKSVARRLLNIAPPSARALRRPALNVLVGARYLRELLSLFRGNVPLAIASYNAGAGRLKRWWQENPGLPTDVFIESLPFSALIDYTQKIVASYDVYRYLYGPRDETATCLALPERLPETLGPYMVRDPAFAGPAEVPETPAPTGEDEAGATAVPEDASAGAAAADESGAPVDPKKQVKRPKRGGRKDAAKDPKKPKKKKKKKPERRRKRG